MTGNANDPISQQQFSHVTQKLNKVEEDLATMTRENSESYKKILPTLAKHSIIHLITGGAITLMVPILAVWVFKSAEHIDTLTRSVIILEERSKLYEPSQSSQTGVLGIGNYWKVTAEGRDYCLLDRTPVEREPSEHFLYPNWAVSSRVELQPGIQKENVPST